ncbi:hypothetical protein [Microbulbifer halophilus]|uniref:hypothetical protein n=1 Tax=Microbulbifer halophilus TaxID=453963 RepID=UPI0036235381
MLINGFENGLAQLDTERFGGTNLIIECSLSLHAITNPAKSFVGNQKMALFSFCFLIALSKSRSFCGLLSTNNENCATEVLGIARS